ncbi:MAG: 30S ribosomal protein S17e [Candidatus Altiarchaeota archaeon]|nr:30S ribosomal protein S17e [Candidatus Altiarchaeota archaeon]
MGKVRPTLVKRTSRKVLASFPERFNSEFEHNKRAVSDLLIFPSKRLRNMVAGYVTTLFRQKE